MIGVNTHLETGSIIGMKIGLKTGNVVPMNQDMIRHKKLDWLLPLAAAVGVPLALLAAGPTKDIAEAFERLGDGYILTFAAAANALTVIP